MKEMTWEEWWAQVKAKEPRETVELLKRMHYPEADDMPAPPPPKGMKKEGVEQ